MAAATSIRHPGSIAAVVMIVAGVAMVIGAIMPWATVTVTTAATDLLGQTPSVSLMGMDLDRTYAAGVLICGGIAVIAGLLLVAERRRLRPVALVTLIVGPVATIGCALGVQKASSAAASFTQDLGPAGLLGGLVQDAGIVHVDLALGIWIAAIGGIIVAVASLVVYHRP